MTTYLTTEQCTELAKTIGDGGEYFAKTEPVLIHALCNAAIAAYLADAPSLNSYEEAAEPQAAAWRYRPNSGWGWSFVELKPIDTVNYIVEPLYTRDQLLACIAKEQDKWHAEHKCECSTEDACRFARERDEALKELAKAKGEK